MSKRQLTIGHTQTQSKEKRTNLRRVLEKRFELNSDLSLSENHSNGIDRENIVYVNGMGLAEKEILATEPIAKALEQRTPIIIDHPSPEILLDLGALGVEAEVAVVTKWNDVLYHVYTLGGAVTSSEQNSVRQRPPREAMESQTSKVEAPSASTADNLERPLEESIEQWYQSSLVESVIDFLDRLDELEERLVQATASPILSNEVPSYRKWSTIHDTDWVIRELRDPYGGKKTQHARFRLSLIFSLLAVDFPAKKKFLRVVVGGLGFEPKTTGESMIAYNNWGRTFMQALTSVEFRPSDERRFGFLQDYLPKNSSGEVSVSSGYSWSIGYNSNKEVSATISVDKSHTKTITDFRTLTETIGQNGIKFSNNVRAVETGAEIEARNLFKAGFNSDKRKLFNWPGTYVREWPSLSRELIKPDSEAIWYAPADEAGIGSLAFRAEQGLISAFLDFNLYVASAKHSTMRSYAIPFGAVRFDS